ncbi:MAG TPA: peptidoglycan bridge formation glycyltransferase FemA/FemB family protein, partial [Solirubrobacteraceae bacterium]
MSSAARGGTWTADAWDRYVRRNAHATYLQATAWARVKAGTGWTSVLVGESSGEHGALGAQILTRPVPAMPWIFAYAPRGPLADEWNDGTHAAWQRVVHSAALAGGPLARAALLRMDPEVEDSPEVSAALEESGWRRAHDMQPRRTRIVDLAEDEASLWSGLRKKWRQYVNKARSNDVIVRDVDPTVETGAFDAFHGVMREVSRRTALPLRSAQAFRDVWAAFAPTGESRLLFAESKSGEVEAVLLLVRCGAKV